MDAGLLSDPILQKLQVPKKSFKTFKISKLNSVKVGYKKKENTSINYSDNQKKNSERERRLLESSHNFKKSYMSMRHSDNRPISLN